MKHVYCISNMWWQCGGNVVAKRNSGITNIIMNYDYENDYENDYEKDYDYDQDGIVILNNLKLRIMIVIMIMKTIMIMNGFIIHIRFHNHKFTNYDSLVYWVQKLHKAL